MFHLHNSITIAIRLKLCKSPSQTLCTVYTPDVCIHFVYIPQQLYTLYIRHSNIIVHFVYIPQQLYTLYIRHSNCALCIYSIAIVLMYVSVVAGTVTTQYATRPCSTCSLSTAGVWPLPSSVTPSSPVPVPALCTPRTRSSSHTLTTPSLSST